MITQKINSNLSFGKTTVGRFRINKTHLNGQTGEIPVKVSRLDDEYDYIDRFDRYEIENISYSNLFENMEKSGWKTDYIIEEMFGKIIGIARCLKYEGNYILNIIGTDKTHKYKGAGRALLAGIISDARNQQYQRVIVSEAVPSAHGFYKKCHFKQESSDTFCIDEFDYDKLINDTNVIESLSD